MDGKPSFLAHFRVSGPKKQKTGFFGKNRAMSLFSPYSGLTSCKESEKSLEPFSVTFGNQLPPKNSNPDLN